MPIPLKHICTAAVAALMAFPAHAEKIRVGYFFFPGFCEERAGDRVEGFIPSWVDQVASAAGWDVERVDCDVETGVEKLKSGDIDVLPAVPYTDDRAKDVLLSRLHCGLLKNYLFVPKGREFNPSRPDGWSGMSVGVLKGSHLAQVLPHSKRIFGFDFVIREYASVDAALEAVLAGKCQGVANCANRRIITVGEAASCALDAKCFCCCLAELETGDISVCGL